MGKIAIGFDIGGTNLRAALIREEGHILERRSVLSEADKGIEFVVKNLARLIQQTIKGGGIAGVGIGIPGIIDSSKGILTQAPNICNVNNYPLRDMLIEKIGQSVPVFIENDANCAAIGEWWIGAGKDAKSLIILTLGTGVGGGIILDGVLWNGADGMAGEIGHITIYPDGAKCNCGNFGCLESYASAVAIRRMVNHGLERNVETIIREKITNRSKERIPEIVAEAAIEGDKFALWVWEEVGKALGIAIADLVNLLNVEMVIIGGGLANAWELFIDRAKKEAKKRGLRAPIKRAKIVKGVLGDDAGILGAGYLVFKEKGII
ncbi:MAG: ROK family protein [Thermodesulfobacteriota bacterium]|jgi:glucokinase